MAGSSRILVVDDDPEFLKMLSYVLGKSGYEVEQALDGHTALAIARDFLPQVVITDLMMPGMDGTALCQELKADPALHPVYVIMLTARSDERVSNLQVGADDYIVKPALMAELRARIQVGLRWVEAQAQLQKAATSDRLTGLPNRRLLDEVLEREMARVRVEGLPLSLMLLDLDHFKQVNDTYGHAIGDLALQQLAEIIRSQVRSSDIPARLGGEEFVIVLPGVDQDTTMRVAGRLRAAVATRLWPAIVKAAAQTMPGVRIDGTRWLTASIGVATLDSTSSWGPAELLQAADRAVYRAKQDGRNRVHLFGALTSEPPATDQMTTGPGLASGQPGHPWAAAEGHGSEVSVQDPQLPTQVLGALEARAVAWVRWHEETGPEVVRSAGVTPEDAQLITCRVPWTALPASGPGSGEAVSSLNIAELGVTVSECVLDTAVAVPTLDTAGQLQGGVWAAWDRPLPLSPATGFILKMLAHCLALELELQRLRAASSQPVVVS